MFNKQIRHCILVQWGSEYLTISVFKWLQRGWMPNGPVFERHLITGKPDHLNTEQMDAICDFFVLVQYLNGQSSA